MPLPAPYGTGLTHMQLVVFTAVGLAGLVCAYGFGLGGTMAFLIFLAVLFVGVCVRAVEPIMQRLRP